MTSKSLPKCTLAPPRSTFPKKFSLTQWRRQRRPDAEIGLYGLPESRDRRFRESRLGCSFKNPFLSIEMRRENPRVRADSGSARQNSRKILTDVSIVPLRDMSAHDDSSPNSLQRLRKRIALRTDTLQPHTSGRFASTLFARLQAGLPHVARKGSDLRCFWDGRKNQRTTSSISADAEARQEARAANSR